MHTTSTETLRPSGDPSGAGDISDSCEICGAPVDLTKTAVFKRNRIVGCPDCTWGAVPSGTT